MKKILTVFLALASTVLAIEIGGVTFYPSYKKAKPGAILALDMERTGAWVDLQLNGLGAGSLALADGWLYALPSCDANYPMIGFTTKEGSGSLKLKWRLGRFEIKTGCNVVPTIGPDGTVYVHGKTHKLLYAYKQDGSLKWKFEVAGILSHSTALGPDGTVYFTSKDAYLYALAPNGTMKWRHRFESGGITLPVVASDGTIYLRQSVQSYTDTNFIALNPDGSVKWFFNGDVFAPTEDDVERYSVSMGTQMAIGSDATIYVSVYVSYDTRKRNNLKDSYCVALDPKDGSMKWKQPYHVGSGPALGEDGTIYFGSMIWNEVSQRDEWHLVALSPDGPLKWKLLIGEGRVVVSPPSVGSNGVIYFGSGRDLYAVNPDGTVKWKTNTTTPSGYGGSILASLIIDDDGVAYFYNGKLYAIKTEARGLANSSWPKWRHDNRNTGCAAK